MKIYRDITDYLCKKCQTCLEGESLELVETLHVDGVSIVRVPSVVWKELGQRPQRYT